MRHIVACPDCHRQYDARQIVVGKHFRCRCGTPMAVAAPHGHDARVIRCSSCGAARREGARSCDHCGSDFTLFERDLHTICPECFARVSDRARYCHQCATLLAPEERVGEATEFRCPACRDSPRLRGRRLGSENFSALECNACAGLWLGFEVFEHLTRQAKESEVPPVITGRDRPTKPRPDQPPKRRGYRPCPRCGSLMNRRNYGQESGRRSGVIIEFCTDHGVWFDSGDLNGILDWLKKGGELERPHLIRTPDLGPPSDRNEWADDWEEVFYAPPIGPQVPLPRSGLGRLLDLLFPWARR